MPRPWRQTLGLGILVMAAAGCRAPLPPLLPTPASYTPPAPPLELPTTTTSAPLELDFSRLPKLDATSIVTQHRLTEFHVINEELVHRESAKRATVRQLVEGESAVPGVLGELRQHLGDEASNRAALNALEQYFQLADVNGREAILLRSLPVLDELRRIVKESREKALQVPVELDELERQRATLVGLLSQAEMGRKLLEIDLKRRLGIDGRSGVSLQPQGPFAVTETPLDPESLVQVALETRGDLRLLRAAYHVLSPATLPTVRQLLQERAGIPNPPPPRLLGRHRMPNIPDFSASADLEVRRQQLYDLVLERERAAADEVRAAAATFQAQTKLVTLARWRLESLQKKADASKDQGLIIPKLAQIEVFRAEADLVTSVMTWHQARVRLNAAQGLYARCPEPSSPQLAPQHLPAHP